jgi:hypothetical protein
MRILEVAMAEIDVQKTPTPDGWRFTVAVSEGPSRTQHQVTLGHTAYERLSGGEVSPETLVSEAFSFLLAREPKEAILREFDLTVIGQYFPEFEAEVKRRRSR